MTESIRGAIEKIAARVSADALTPDEAMKLTQAAYNLAHTASLIAGIDEAAKQAARQ